MAYWLSARRNQRDMMHDLSKPARVRVRAPGRLHLGFLDLNGNLGRVYGSIGLAVDEPATELTLTRHTLSGASGPEAARTVRAIERFARYLNTETGFHADVIEALPAHAGLGSGTQLAIAVGAAMCALEDREVHARTLGEALERGARSAIGIAAFENGGFILDGGRGSKQSAPPVLSLLPFPSDWRVLLVLDNNASGVHGERETQAFRNLEPMPEETAAHLCRLALMRLLPGLAEKDLASFGAAITEIQETVGTHFAKAQGGSIWTAPNVAGILERMAAMGAVGIGQSSWGPTGFAFVDGQNTAEGLYQSLVREAKAVGVEIRIVRGRNRGADIEIQSMAEG